MPHFFQSLAEGEVIVQIGDTVLGDQKISYVHCDASFLGAGGPPVFDRIRFIVIVYRKCLGK